MMNSPVRANARMKRLKGCVEMQIKSRDTISAALRSVGNPMVVREV